MRNEGKLQRNPSMSLIFLNKGGYVPAKLFGREKKVTEKIGDEIYTYLLTFVYVT
jgi:hypothetical protein